MGKFLFFCMLYSITLVWCLLPKVQKCLSFAPKGLLILALMFFHGSSERLVKKTLSILKRQVLDGVKKTALGHGENQKSTV